MKFVEISDKTEQKMIVTLMCEDKLYDVLLPKKICGRYWIEDPDLEITDQRKRIISIEGERMTFGK